MMEGMMWRSYQHRTVSLTYSFVETVAAKSTFPFYVVQPAAAACST